MPVVQALSSTRFVAIVSGFREWHSAEPINPSGSPQELELGLESDKHGGLELGVENLMEKLGVGVALLAFLLAAVVAVAQKEVETEVVEVGLPGLVQFSTPKAAAQFGVLSYLE